LDVHQGFADFLLLRPRENSFVTLRVGRQELAVGSGRLVALREGPNVPLSFDGVRLLLRSHAWQIDGFATRPVQIQTGIFDDPPQHDSAFWGAYATHPLLTGSQGLLAFDFYYLGIDRKHSVFNQGAARETRHTVGARIYGQRAAWSYDTEGMF